jgi:hypothetical protein
MNMIEKETDPNLTTLLTHGVSLEARSSYPVHRGSAGLQTRCPDSQSSRCDWVILLLSTLIGPFILNRERPWDSITKV